MKTKFTTDALGQVTVSYDTEDYGDVIRVNRTFTCPADGGYVREYRKGKGDWLQVCTRLSHTGSTLLCSSRNNLLPLIRREYEAMRRAEKRAPIF